MMVFRQVFDGTVNWHHATIPDPANPWERNLFVHSGSPRMNLEVAFSMRYSWQNTQ